MVTEGLSARGVCVELSGRPILEGAALDVPNGAVTALVAPSGAGKSTLLRACVRLVELRAGTVTLDGTDVATLPATALRRRVGLVAQVPAMLPGTVADNVGHGCDGDVTAALAAADLGAAYAERAAAELSGGERARVALARALARDPQVLLLDEPSAALDAASADRIGETLRALAGRGLAICVATHDERFVAAVADRREGLT